MTTFGHFLRIYRRQCHDPLRGGVLTQSRLGELIGQEIGDVGYSGAAVSDWERDKSKIHADDRLVLVALLAVLHQCGGLTTLTEANAFLAAGNYRALDETERAQVFPDMVITPSPTAVPRAVAIAHLHTRLPAHPPTERRRKQLILLEKVENFWVNGVLEKAVGETMLLDVAWERYDTAVAHPWQELLETAQPTAADIPGVFTATDRALLILGSPGSGKTITLIALARTLISRAHAEATQPIPVILNLASWAENRSSLADWVVAELTAKYQVPRNLGRDWLEADDLILLLDGLDEVTPHHQAACIQAINQFRQTHGLTGIVVCSRLVDYQSAQTPLKLSGAIRLLPLSSTQIEAYLTAVHIPTDRARHAIVRDSILGEMVQSPLMLRVLSDSYRPDTAVNITPSTDSETRRRQVFETYVNQALARSGALSH
ncbi:MAG TPA: NACHT domain-containing protein, partial [Chloroflexota bacterium]|nr:NACHT domain-containing protein [Chloroflexota bacterium]